MTFHQAKIAVSESKRGGGRDIINAGSIKMVTAGTGREDVEKVKEVEVHVIYT